MGLNKALPPPNRKADVYYKTMLESTSSLYYLFSPFHPLVSAPRYAFTVFNLQFSCASMILDDCLTIISPSPQLSADLSQSLPTYKFIFTNSFAVHIFLSRNLVRPSHRPPLLVASPVCSLIYCLVRTSRSGVPFPSLPIVTSHPYTALLSIIMSLYYLNEFHACLPSFRSGARSLVLQT